jgi:putative flippase GtrA
MLLPRTGCASPRSYRAERSPAKPSDTWMGSVLKELARRARPGWRPSLHFRAALGLGRRPVAAREPVAADASRSVSASGAELGRTAKWCLVLLVLVPVVFNAIALLPELTTPIPSLNDDGFHYHLVQSTSRALSDGQNVLDYWSPELDLGFPTSAYYQHLPHLAVVFLHRALFEQVGLFTLFNLVRYLLLIGFPLTVFWSMRRMGFGVVACCFGAAAASLLSADHRYGFEYDSYTWRGFGMYTQLWAMHLSFIALACLYRLLQRGNGYILAILACSALILSHVVYVYMFGITSLLLLVVGLNQANLRARAARFAVFWGVSALITSYFWLPFLLGRAYLSTSPYLQQYKFDSFGAHQILGRLVTGDLLDYGRLPVLTVLLGIGAAWALFGRTPPARLALVLFAAWLCLYFGRATYGRLADLLPLHDSLLLHRFIGGVDLAAIMLIGLGGEWLWFRLRGLAGRVRRAPPVMLAAAPALALVLLLIPAMKERAGYYALNSQWMTRAQRALDADADARTILATLQQLPPGRTFAGLPATWGKILSDGDLHFTDLMVFNQVVGALPPLYQGYSLNADLMWHFDDHNPAHYALFNVRYVVAPTGLEQLPGFLQPIKVTPRYTLYEHSTTGYAEFASVERRESVGSPKDLFFRNRAWFLSSDPGKAQFVRYDYPSSRTEPLEVVPSACPAIGTITAERESAGMLDIVTQCSGASTLVLKMTYHPNWQVTVDGRRTPTFMVSPSFIGLNLPPGQHAVHAAYQATSYKTALAFFGLAIALALVLFLPARRLVRRAAGALGGPAGIRRGPRANGSIGRWQVLGRLDRDAAVAEAWRIARYAGVGTLAAAVYVVLSIAIEHSAHAGAQLASWIGLTASAATGYVGHRTVTFRSRGAHAREAPRYLALMLIGYAVSFVLIKLLVERHLVPYPAALGGIAVTLAGTSYLFNRSFVFRVTSGASSSAAVTATSLPTARPGRLVSARERGHSRLARALGAINGPHLRSAVSGLMRLRAALAGRLRQQ